MAVFGYVPFLSCLLISLSIFSNLETSKDEVHYKQSLEIEQSCVNLEFENIFDRLVLIIIDALPFRFLKSLGDGDSRNNAQQFRMPFMERIVLEQGISVKGIANMPTVTMPGIKALMGGIVPTMFDYLDNLNAETFEEANLLKSFKNRSKKVVFYGDEVWLRLFGVDLFDRYNFTDSFFATDYTFVDKNVTWNVEKELQKLDSWDVMILHYLGVDHIGHLDGSKSVLFDEKLLEMDGVIEKIFSTLKNTNSLIIVTSDHGMTDDGNHGGDSGPEVETPVIYISTSEKHKKISEDKKIETFKQTDFCATISGLFRLEFPTTNSGILICSVLERFQIPKNQILCSLFYNIVQLRHNLHEISFGNFKDKKLLLEDGIKYHSKYLESFNVEDYEKSRDNYLSYLRDIQRNFDQPDLFSSDKSLYYFMVMQVFLFLSISLFIREYLNRSTSILFESLKYSSITIAILGLNCAFRGSMKFLLLEHLYWTVIQLSLIIIELVQQIHKPIDCILSLIVLVLLTFWKQIKNDDKAIQWLNIPDIYSILIRSEMKQIKSLLFLSSVFFVVFFANRASRVSPILSQTCSFITFFSIFLYRFQTNSVYLPFLSIFRDFGTPNLWANIVFLHIFLNFISRIFFKDEKNGAKNLLEAVIQAFLELSSLIVETSLVPCILLSVILESLIFKILSANSRPNIWKFCFYMTFSIGSFYQLGNSNQLSTVSVSACFIGQNSYNLFICAFLMLNSIYSVYIFWILSLFKRFLTEKYQNMICLQFIYSCSTIAMQMFVTFLLRTRPFVWSLIAPKLLYDFIFILLNGFIQFFILVYSFFISK